MWELRRKKIVNFKLRDFDSFYVLLALFMMFIYEIRALANSTYEENLRKQLFETPNEGSCKPLTSHPSGTISITPLLDQFVKKALISFNTESSQELAKLFHPRLGIKEAQLTEILAKLHTTYGQKLEITVNRLWALNTVDGTPLGLKCTDPEITLNTLYGYNLQFVLWLQIMGSEEIGRIYLPIVFSSGKWLLGGLHVHQWTHDLKNYADWANRAQSSKDQNLDLVAFIEYDLAEKLGNGDRFFILSDIPKIEEKKKAIMTSKDFETKIKSLFPTQAAVYVSTLFVKKGAGILLRFRVDKEISLNSMKEFCNKTKDNLAKVPWSKKIAAIRCSFVLPKEDPEKEGLMGGILLEL